MNDVGAAQIVAIFGTLWMVLVGLQMLNGTALGRGSTAAAEIASDNLPRPGDLLEHRNQRLTALH
jgi:hypothetical protein